MPHVDRRACAFTLVALLVGCASGGPPPRSVRLAIDPPAAPRAVAADAQVWQLIEPVVLPAYLDRETLLLPAGPGAVRSAEALRWAEPLRDALPRLLRADLAAWRGGDRVWAAPVPNGVVVTRRLRVELLALDVTPERDVRLRAQWSIEAVPGGMAPATGATDFVEGTAGAGDDALVAAHRAALWRLAGAIAGAR